MVKMYKRLQTALIQACLQACTSFDTKSEISDHLLVLESEIPDRMLVLESEISDHLLVLESEISDHLLVLESVIPDHLLVPVKQLFFQACDALKQFLVHVGVFGLFGLFLFDQLRRSL